MRHDTPQAAAVSPDAQIDVTAVDASPRSRRPRGPLRSTPHSLSEADAAVYLGVSRAYLRQDRAKAVGTGPAFCRFGRAVRYRLADLDACIAAHRIDPTARARRA